MAHTGGSPLNFDQLQADQLFEQQAAERQGGFANISGNARRSAFDRLQLLLKRSASFDRSQQGPQFSRGPAALGTSDPGLHGFAQRKNEEVERLKLQQFLSGKVPSDFTPRASVASLENFGSQLNTQPIPRQGEEQRDLFRSRISPGRFS